MICGTENEKQGGIWKVYFQYRQILLIMKAVATILFRLSSQRKNDLKKSEDCNSFFVLRFLEDG